MTHVWLEEKRITFKSTVGICVDMFVYLQFPKGVPCRKVVAPTKSIKVIPVGSQEVWKYYSAFFRKKSELPNKPDNMVRSRYMVMTHIN